MVGVHFVGGWIGSLWIGFFATSSPAFDGLGAHEGLFYGGGVAQLGRQAVGGGVVTVWSFVVALVIGFIIEKTIGFRVKPEAEVDGIDVAEHAESAYDFTRRERRRRRRVRPGRHRRRQCATPPSRRRPRAGQRVAPASVLS